MRTEYLFTILKKFILIIIFSFIIFVVTINLIKLFTININVKKVLKTLNNDDNDFNYLNSEKKEINYFINDEGFTASKLGFKNYIYDINGSEWGQGVNILLIGSDKKSYKDNKARSDVIIILRIINSGKILSISIPRDTLVKINDGEWTGCDDKIGHSLYWGGIDNLKKNIEELIGSQICRIVIIDNFKNFEAFLTVIGGIKIDKKLIGSTGIQWIRNRNFKDGDIERCKRQQVFLKHSIIKLWKITNNGNYFYSNYFFNFLKRIIYTDLSNEEFNYILYILKKNKFNPSKDFLTGILPGRFSKYDSLLLKRNQLDCWLLDEEILKKIQFLFYSNDNFLIQYNINYLSFLKINFKNLLKKILPKIIK